MWFCISWLNHLFMHLSIYLYILRIWLCSSANGTESWYSSIEPYREWISILVGIDSPWARHVIAASYWLNPGRQKLSWDDWIIVDRDVSINRNITINRTGIRKLIPKLCTVQIHSAKNVWAASVNHVIEFRLNVKDNAHFCWILLAVACFDRTYFSNSLSMILCSVFYNVVHNVHQNSYMYCKARKKWSRECVIWPLTESKTLMSCLLCEEQIVHTRSPY